MRKHHGVMREVYRDQLRIQRMTAQYWGTDSAGRAVTDITIPKNVPRQLDNVAQKLYFTGQMAKSAGTQVINMGKNMQWAGRQLTVGFTYPVALFGAAAGVMAYKVDEAMTRVVKVYDVSAEAQKNEALRTKELNDLKQKSFALTEKAAKSYGMRIEDTLEIEQRLAATGLRGDILLDSTKETARISTLGDLEIGAATDMTVALQNAFKDTIKDAKDLTETFDYMNAVENSTSLALADIAEATPRAASGLASLGVTAKEMTVLLVAMKERGVGAAEGANALKSATTRILNPVRRATAFYEQYGISLEKISEQSGGNLFDFLKRLSVEQSKIVGQTEKDTARLRQKGIANLFGTYQFNRLNAALVGVGEAMNGTGDQASQTAKAFELMGVSAKENAEAAEGEIAEKMEAASGKFKAAWETLRTELYKMGAPFLSIATSIAEVAGNVMGFFNGMSDAKKKAAIAVAALMAIAGPIVMLGGLFMNLAGQFVLGSGRVLSALGRISGARAILTKEEQAASLTADAQSKALHNQKQTTSSLSQEIHVLTAAYEKATKAAMAYAQTQGVAASAQAVAKRTISGRGFATPYHLYGREAEYFDQTASRAPSATGAAGAFRSNAVRLDEARNRMANEYMQSMGVVARNATDIEKATAREAKIREKMRGSINGARLGTAAMGISMAAMMLPLGETTSNFGKWLMIATIVVPALKAVAETTGAAAKAAWSMAAANMASAKAARANAAATGAAYGRFGTMRAGLSGITSGIVGVLGKGGLLGLGVAAVGGAAMFAWSKVKAARIEAQEAYREQVKLANNVEGSTRKWAEQMGIVVGHYDRVAQASEITSHGGPKAANRQQELIEYYKTKPEGGKTSPVQDFQAVVPGDTPVESVDTIQGKMLATQKFIDLQVEARLTAEEAAQHMRAFYIALGLSASQAEGQAQSLLVEWGSVKDKAFDWAGYLDQQMRLFEESDSAGMNAAGKNASEAFWAGMENYKGDPSKAQALVDRFTNQTVNNVEGVWESMGEKYGRDWFDMMATQGVTNAEEFARLLHSTTMEEFARLPWTGNELMRPGPAKPGAAQRVAAGEGDGWSIDYSEIQAAVSGVNHEHHQLINNLDKIVGFGDTVKSVFDLPDAHEVKALTTTYDEAAKIVAGMGADGHMLHMMEESDRATQAAVINTYNLAHGFKQGATHTEAVYNFMNKVKASTSDAATEAKKLRNELANASNTGVKLTQVSGITRTAMSAVQERMATSAMNKFDKGWDARIQREQNSWNNHMEGLVESHKRAADKMDERQDRAKEAFDERWKARREAVEKAYEKRAALIQKEIDAEKKADEVRARLFEKEKARLAKLAELENADTDFNTALNEGRLDDAAKTLNNTGVSSANAQMDAEQKAAEARTAARIEALEKKNERLKKARDKELENLKKLEDRMRKHLDRVQDARRKALERQQRDEVKAVEKSETNSIKSMERQRDYEKAMLEERLELFKSYTARNQKDLDKWMKQVGMTYDDFGTDIKAKGDDWSKHFRTELSKQMRKAGNDVVNDNVWENAGAKIGRKLLKGLGFDGLADFRRFVRTGEMPSGGGKGKKGGGKSGQQSGPGGSDHRGQVETRHAGGVVGSGGGSRKGIPNTYKGLHRSEQMVRAQKGEYVINKNSAKGNMELLEAINKGSDVMPPGEGGIGFGGPMGVMAGAIQHMFASGVEKAYNNAYQTGIAKQQSNFGPGGSFLGQAGKYGGTAWTAEQMKNAAIIASVGSGMGMSQRDIMIGIMTAIAESSLVNIKGGHLDSLGLFQQRPSMGWGTPEQIMNPRYAAAKFFGPLKAHSERTEESPWLAAQHIQRSAYADGSNYAKWWEAAQAIFRKGLSKQDAGVSGGFVMGRGGRHRPIAAAVTNGLHGGNSPGNPPAVDMAVPTGRPVFAVADGVVTASKDIYGPLPTDRYRGDGPYGSFGRVVQMQTDSGAGIVYAHLSRRSVSAGTRVKGGSTLGYSGNSGNSSGPHLHFGATNGPYAWLRKGGTVKYDDTPAMLHRGETVLTDSLTRQFKDNVGSGSGGDAFHVTLDLRGATIKEDVDIEKAVNKAIDTREAKLGRKRVVK